MSRLVFLLVLALAGCSKQEHDAFHHPSPETMGLIANWHADRQRAAIAAISDLQDGKGDYIIEMVGRSNGYNWGNAWAVASRVDFNSLKVGQLIIFKHEGTGILVSHTVVARDSGGWITSGTGNSRKDSGRVTADNFVSRVVRVHTWPQ